MGVSPPRRASHSVVVSSVVVSAHSLACVLTTSSNSISMMLGLRYNNTFTLLILLGERSEPHNGVFNQDFA